MSRTNIELSVQAFRKHFFELHCVAHLKRKWDTRISTIQGQVEIGHECLKRDCCE
jgi:hypothetical protein